MTDSGLQTSSRYQFEGCILNKCMFGFLQITSLNSKRHKQQFDLIFFLYFFCFTSPLRKEESNFGRLLLSRLHMFCATFFLISNLITLSRLWQATLLSFSNPPPSSPFALQTKLCDANNGSRRGGGGKSGAGRNGKRVKRELQCEGGNPE